MLVRQRILASAALILVLIGAAACQGMPAEGARGGPGNAPVGSPGDFGKYGQ